MVYFARIIFFLKNGSEPLNLTKRPTPLFSKGKATCSAASTNSLSSSGIVFSYGPFYTRDEARDEGIRLYRLIKISMLERGIPISQETTDGVLDHPGCVISCNDPSDWENLIRFFPKSQQMSAGEYPKSFMNEFIGIGIYEVEHSLDEIVFVGGSVNITTSFEITLQNRDYPRWDKSMDVSLSYLCASEEVRDSRVKLLLSIMAIEALVSKAERRDTHYLEALEKLKSEIENLTSTEDDIKKRLRSHIGNLNNKGIGEKVKNLLSIWLPNNTYCGDNAFKFFDRCYTARCKLTHAGEIDADIGELCGGLKELALDLLRAKSEGIPCNAGEPAIGMDAENDKLRG